MRINYIKNEQNNTVINPSEIIYDKRALRFIKDLCIHNLFTLEGYFKSVRTVLNIKQKIPIYINNQIILFYLKGLSIYDNVFINYIEINKIVKNCYNIIVIFKDNEKLSLNISYYEYLNHVKRVQKIIKYKNNL
ncbi:MAG: competence protein ComK [Acholeplasmataceae bacterium]